jgi:periplasmic protein TonB
MSAFLYLLAVASTTAEPASYVAPPAPPPGSYRPYPVGPKPLDYASWFAYLTYPPDALREDRQGVTLYELVIDARGLPNGCRVIESSGHQDLDAMTCDILVKRARFSPARDKENKAIGSWYRGRMRWVLQPDGPEATSVGVPATNSLPKEN